MARSLKCGAWRGVPLDIDDVMVKLVMDKVRCLVCMLGKTNHLARSEGSGARVVGAGEVISIDAIVKVNPISTRLFTGFYLMKERRFGFMMCVLFKEHNAEQVVKAVEKFRMFLRSHGHRPRILQFDAGRVENSARVSTALAEWGMTVVSAATEEQCQNPVERDVQTLKKGVSSMMIDQQSLSRRFWCFAVEDFVEAKNVVVNTVLGDVSPEEGITGEAPNISERFRFPWGMKVVVARAGKKEFTFQTKNEFAVVLGSADLCGQVPVFIPTRVGFKYDRLHVTPLLTQEKDITAEQSEALLPTTTQSTELGIDEEVEFKSPADEESDYAIPFQPLRDA